MEISVKDSNELKNIIKSYGEVHAKVEVLDGDMKELLVRKEQVTKELTDLREAEVSLINKIEEDTGIKMTQERLTEIVNT